MCVRDHNQLLVLHTIRTRGRRRVGISRALTGLTFQTIENISRRLIDAGILEDVPPPALMGRARQLVLRPAGAYAIGIEVAPEGCRVALCDLGGRTLAERRLSACAESRVVLDELALMVQDLIDDAEVPITAVVAVGLTVSGSTSIRGRSGPVDQAPPDGASGARWPRTAAPDARPVHQRGHRCSAGRAVVRPDLLPGLHLRASRVGDRVRRHQPWSALHRGERPGRRHRAYARRDQWRTVRVRSAGLPPHRARRARPSARHRNGSQHPRAAHTRGDLPEGSLGPDDAIAAIDKLAPTWPTRSLPAVRLLDPEIVMIGGPIADAVGETFCSIVERRVAEPCGERTWAGDPACSAWRGRGSERGTGVLYEILTPAMDHLILDTVATENSTRCVPGQWQATASTESGT